MTPEERLGELWRKVDGFFERVGGRYPGALTCGPGCTDCCHRQLTVTGVEAARIELLIARLAPEARETLASRLREREREREGSGAGERVDAGAGERVDAGAGIGEACVALGDDGRCAIYEARPVVCRSHGLPLRFVEPAADGRRALPVLDVCPRNFGGRDLGAVDADCVLDQQTLSVLLGAIDALHAKEAGVDPSRRALGDVLRAALAA